MLAETLPDLLARRATAHPDRVALLDAGSGRRVTYSELAGDSMRIAGWLVEQGFEPGDRLAVLADQAIEAWQVLYGAMRASVVPVLVNWRLTPGEMAAIVRDSESRMIVTTRRWDELGETVAVSTSMPHVAAEDLVATAKAVDLRSSDPECRDTAVQLYTSGTTALPKGVCTSHANLLALLDLLSSELPGYGANTRHLVAAPLFHIAGLGFGIAPLAVGATSVLLEAFEPRAALDAIAEHAITHALLVPAMLQMIVAVPGAADWDTSSMCGLLYGGSPISVSLMSDVATALGCPMTQAYGMTETTGIATLLRFDDHSAGLSKFGGEAAERLLSAGRPAIGTEVAIACPDQSGAGEVLVRSPLVMEGYWRRPDANEATLLPDGWLRTGDVGRLDDAGFLYIVDRLSDMVITKGENVFPGEVERVIVEHDAVVEELPRTPSGKVMRRAVREPYWSEHGRRVN
jgi:long-chain acyl-CoA synthetase